MRSNSFFLLWFGLLLPFWLTGQEANDLLRKGKQAILSDQLDSAAVFYQQAFQTTDPDSKIRALGGLIRTAILNSELDRADSLVGLGDQLLKQIPHKENTLWEFQLAKGEYFRKSSQFDRALKQHQEVARAAASDKTAQLTRAYALFYTALTFERTATYDSSLVYIDRAYDLFRQELDTTDLRFSEIYNGLGVCYYRSARYDESKIFYLESKRLAEQHLGPVSTDLAIALNNLSSISRANENYREAIDYSEQALSIYRALDDKSGQSGVFYSIGVYYYFLGDYGRTKDYMEACIAIRKQLFPPDHYSLIGPYEVLGIAYEESGDYEKTLQYLEKVRPIIRSNYGEASLLEGFNMENTALCFRSMDQLDSALLYIQRANAIIPQHFSNIDYSLATHHFSYAYISYLRGDYSTAKAMIQRSSEILRQLGMASSSEYAQNRVLEALILTQLNQPEAANGIFQSAIQQIRQDESFQLSPNSLWILNHYTEYLYNLFVKTSDPKVLEDFQTYSGHYLDLSDRFRKQFNDPYTKSILIKDNAEVYNRNIGIYHRLYQKTRDIQYLEAGYRFSEYGRTSLLRDLQDEKIQSYAGIPDSVLIREKTLKKELAQLNRQLIESPDDPNVKQSLFEAKEAFNQYVEATRETYPKYHKLKFQSSIPSLADIQRQLPADLQLIEYMQDDTAYYALLISKQKAQWFYLGQVDAINQQVKEWKEAMIRREGPRLSTLAADLYSALWQPLEAYLTREDITIVPYGPLFYLNFETFRDGEDRFLIERYNLSYGLSINLLLSKENTESDGLILAVAPGFEEEIKQRYQQQLDSLENLDTAYLQTVRQPWSRKLAEKLNRQFASRIYTGLEATESNIKTQLQEGKVLYFGTHAIANPDDPLRSKLVLSKELGSQREDGYLHAYELYGIPLEAELAVLNACESGLGNLQAGEGMISLAYSIHYAGCPSTVMSLWKVDEKISTRITEDFLSYLEQGLSKSQALRQAKLDYLESANTQLQHPFYWGGMVLMGQDGPVDLQKSAGNYWWWLIPGLLLAGLFAFWFRQSST